MACKSTEGIFSAGTAQFDEAVSDIWLPCAATGFMEADAAQQPNAAPEWLAVSSVQAVPTPDTVASSGAGPASSPAQPGRRCHALPARAASSDLLVLPHTLSWSADSHARLREAERVGARGAVVITCIEPNSPGFRQSRRLVPQRVPWTVWQEVALMVDARQWRVHGPIFR
jgi:hypothetical protein